MFHRKLAVCWDGLHYISYHRPKLSIKFTAHTALPCSYLEDRREWGIIQSDDEVKKKAEADETWSGDRDSMEAEIQSWRNQEEVSFTTLQVY